MAGRNSLAAIFFVFNKSILSCLKSGLGTRVAIINPRNSFPLKERQAKPIANFTTNVVNGGPSDSSSFSDPSNLVSATAWTSGQLDAFLGISASPANPIGAWLPCAQTGTSANCGTGAPYLSDPGATGFFVYRADLGTNVLASPGSPTGNPNFTYSVGLPQDSFVVGFLNTGTASSPSWIATANSGALFIDSKLTTTTVPEPTSLLLMGTGLGRDSQAVDAAADQVIAGSVCRYGPNQRKLIEPVHSALALFFCLGAIASYSVRSE